VSVAWWRLGGRRRPEAAGGRTTPRRTNVSDILRLPHDTERPAVHHTGWDYFTAAPGSVDEARCRVCGEVMADRRGVVGPTSWAHAMAIAAGVRGGAPHDAFACNFSGEAWHWQALALKEQAEETPSKRLERLLLEEAAEIVRRRVATKDVSGLA
jgi:hypothetical protein